MDAYRAPEDRLRDTGATHQSFQPAPLPRGRTVGRLQVLSVDDALTAPPRDYILKGIMAPAELSLWWGAPKCGKSFLLLHTAYAISQGRFVFGRRVKPCPVMYVAAEGQAGLSRRVRALRQEHGGAPRFSFVAQPTDLLRQDGDLGDLIDAAKLVRAGLIVIDTLNRVMAGGDENSSQDMGLILTAMDRLRTETGAHVAVVHHGTKSNGSGGGAQSSARGHSSLPGAADAIIHVEKLSDGTRTATVQQAKDDPDSVAMAFRLEPVELGRDEDGDPITTLLVVETEAVPGRAHDAKPTSKNRALEILTDLLATEGKPPPAAWQLSVGIRTVPEERWRDECDTRRLSTAETKEARSKAFRRAFNDLLSAHNVAARDGLVWLAN